MKRPYAVFHHTLLSCLLTFAMTQAASAQMTEAQKDAMKANCRSDYMANCMGVTPGGKEALMCLKGHMAKLSPGCQKAVKSAFPEPAPTPPPAAAAPPPATAPAAAHAPTATAAPPPAAAPAKAATTAPVKKKTKTATAPVPVPAAPPAEAVPTLTAQQMSAIKFTCRGDFRRMCKDVPPGGAAAFECLLHNFSRLAPDCKTSVADIVDNLPATPPTPPTPITPAVQQPVKPPLIMTPVIARACLLDLVRHCREVGIGDGKKLACLAAHEQRLAFPCKAALKVAGVVP